MRHATDRRTSRDRPRRAIGLVAAAGVALGGTLVGLAGPTAAPAAAAVPADECPADGQMPGIGNVPTFTDDNVAVYAGGDYLATGTSAESEGLLLVRGDATFDKDSGGLFNVGAVGVGSGITPAPGTTMLAVGGNLTITDDTRVEVGANIDGGGGVRVGGAITAGGGLDTNGAPVTVGLGANVAMEPYADFQATITGLSADLASATSTGSVAVTGNQLTITGAGGTSLEHVQISAADLDGVTEVYIEGIDEGAALAITVTGGPVDFGPNYFAIDGVRVDDLTSADFGNAASRLMWNVADAEQLTLSGSSQFMGSILAPVADTEITASTNGRVYVGGDLTTRGVGNEQHNYPWIGAPETDCIITTDAVGGFSVVKDVVGAAAALVPADTEFTVEYTATVGDGAVGGALTVPADGTEVSGPSDLPAGTVVTFVETDLPEVAGVVWGEPEFAPSSVTVVAGGVVRVQLTNTAGEDTTPSPEPTSTPTPDPTSTPGPTPEPTPTEPTPTEPGDGGALPRDDEPASTPGQPGALPVTGAQAGLLAATAAVLLAAGTWLLMSARRRRAARA